jgi:hypothetical protein
MQSCLTIQPSSVVKECRQHVLNIPHTRIEQQRCGVLAQSRERLAQLIDLGVVADRDLLDLQAEHLVQLFDLLVALGPYFVLVLSTRDATYLCTVEGRVQR